MKNFTQSIILLLAMTLFINPIFSQVQLGDDIDGEAPGDYFGLAVSISQDGERIAIGTPSNDGNGQYAGQVKVYDWMGTYWSQIGNTLSGDIENNQFGGAISLSGDGSRLSVSSKECGNSSGSRGYVKNYILSGNLWIQIADEIMGEELYSQSGNALEMSASGNTVIIGTELNDGAGSNAGHARVYRFDNAWLQLGDDIDGDFAGDQMGSAVSISESGNRIAVGAYTYGNSVGQVKVYDWNSQGFEQAGSDIYGDADNDISGRAISLSSDGLRLAIGAPWNDDGGETNGQVRVYEWIGGDWVKMGADIDGQGSEHVTGTTVALSSNGSRLAIGGEFFDGSQYSGQVKIFDWDGTNWVQNGVAINCEDPTNESEVYIDLSGDGSRLIIGAPKNNGNGTNAGHARVFEIAPLLLNDQPCQAISVPTDGSVQSLFYNTTATVEANEQSIVPTENDCTTSWCENIIHNSVWFTFVGPPSGSVEISTCDLADFDTQIALYATDNCNFYSNFQLIQANDDGPESCSTDYDSWMQVDGLSPGLTYYILVDGYGGSTGGFGISVLELMSSSTDQITSNSSRLNIYPNPNDGNFFVEMEDLNQPAQLSISDAMGSVIYTEPLSGIASKIELNLEQLTSGLYFVTIQSAKGNLSRKFYIR